MPKATVRQALTAKDAYQIIELLKLWEYETSLPYPPWDEMAMLRWIVRVMSSGYAAVADLEGELIGTIGLTPASFPWNDSQQMMSDEWIMVHPDYRDKGTARALLNHINNMADQFQIPVMLGLMTGGDGIEKKEKFLGYSGYAYTGGQFLRFPKPAEDVDEYKTKHESGIR